MSHGKWPDEEFWFFDKFYEEAECAVDGEKESSEYAFRERGCAMFGDEKCNGDKEVFE